MDIEKILDALDSVYGVPHHPKYRTRARAILRVVELEAKIEEQIINMQHLDYLRSEFAINCREAGLEPHER